MSSAAKLYRKQPVSLFVRLWVEIYELCLKGMGGEMSASSWGCELKYRNHFPDGSGNGCQPLREAVSWNDSLTIDNDLAEVVSLFVRLWVEMRLRVISQCTCWVSLFVRLWVEIQARHNKGIVNQSASSWGCELKWKTDKKVLGGTVSASSWGCELKWENDIIKYHFRGQPLREAVSWNICKRFLFRR